MPTGAKSNTLINADTRRFPDRISVNHQHCRPVPNGEPSRDGRAGPGTFDGLYLRQ